MTKKLALEKVFRDGRAINGVKMLFTPFTAGMNISGDNFFACTGFACNQDICFSRFCHQSDHLSDIADGFALPYQGAADVFG